MYSTSDEANVCVCVFVCMHLHYTQTKRATHSRKLTGTSHTSMAFTFCGCVVCAYIVFSARTQCTHCTIVHDFIIFNIGRALFLYHFVLFWLGLIEYRGIEGVRERTGDRQQKKGKVKATEWFSLGAKAKRKRLLLSVSSILSIASLLDRMKLSVEMKKWTATNAHTFPIIDYACSSSAFNIATEQFSLCWNHWFQLKHEKFNKNSCAIECIEEYMLRFSSFPIIASAEAILCNSLLFSSFFLSLSFILIK